MGMERGGGRKGLAPPKYNLCMATGLTHVGL